MIKPVQWTTQLELLSAQAIQDIHQASLQILAQTGLVMPLDSERQAQALDLGLDIDCESDLIRFPSDPYAYAV